MRLRHAFIGITAVLLPSATSGQLQPLLRDGRMTILLTRCPPGDHDDNCRAIEVQRKTTVMRLGAGYTQVKLLWGRKALQQEGPDALVLGLYGGSGGLADLFAVEVSPILSARKLGGERFDTVAVQPDRDRLRITVPFVIQYFNGASNAGTVVVPLPLLWSGKDFRIDLERLVRHTPPDKKQVDAMRSELVAWARANPGARRLYPPSALGETYMTVQILVTLMLSGHADQARDLLAEAWPRDPAHSAMQIGGKADFWNDLCRAVVSEPSWQRYRLVRLPHAASIEAGARSAQMNGRR